MDNNTMAYFVSFETSLDTGQFISRWENYINSGNSQQVALFKTGIDGKYKYIARYLYNADEFQFVVAKAAKTSRQAVTEVRLRQLGGYAVVANEGTASVKQKDSKIFVFINSPQANLEVYTGLTAKSALNIYQGYYENCTYTYILEFLVKATKVSDLITQLEAFNEKNIEVYKECNLHMSLTT